MYTSLIKAPSDGTKDNDLNGDLYAKYSFLGFVASGDIAFHKHCLQITLSEK